MPTLTPLLPLPAIYGVLYLVYRRKSGGRMKGFPGLPWLAVGSLFIGIAGEPSVNGGSLEVALVGEGFFLVLFSFLAAQRLHLALGKADAARQPGRTLQSEQLAGEIPRPRHTSARPFGG